MDGVLHPAAPKGCDTEAVGFLHCLEGTESRFCVWAFVSCSEEWVLLCRECPGPGGSYVCSVMAFTEREEEADDKD